MQIPKELSALLLSDASVKTLSKSSGATKPQVQKIVNAALPIMLTGMKSNANADKSGAESLLGALTSHSGDDLSDIGAFLNKADAEDGEKIVTHVLGGSKQDITKALASKSGATKGEVGSILSLLAPVLLTAIGNQATSSNTGASGLGGLLGGLLGSGSDDNDIGLGDIASILLAGGSNSGSSSNSGAGSILGSLLSDDSGSNSSSNSGAGSILGSLLGDDSGSGSNSNSNSNSGGGLLDLLFNVFGDN